MQRDAARREFFAVRRAERRRQHFAAQRRIRRMPVDVEMTRVGTVPAPFEDIEPPRVAGAAHAHMVRHHVDEQPHVVRAQLVDEAFQARLAAAFGADLGVVDGVVAVHRSGLGRGNR